MLYYKVFKYINKLYECQVRVVSILKQVDNSDLEIWKCEDEGVSKKVFLSVSAYSKTHARHLKNFLYNSIRKVFYV
jgi:hypothetical protein